MSKRSARLGIGRAIIGLVAAALSLGVMAQEPVKLGLIVPLSGPWARQGQSVSSRRTEAGPGVEPA